jgi:hypothetical protein
MQFLALVHLRELSCAQCGAPLAVPGSRSVIVDENGDPLFFPDAGVPEEISAELHCANGHATRLHVPGDMSAEETMHTPEEAPLAGDATVVT